MTSSSSSSSSTTTSSTSNIINNNNLSPTIGSNINLQLQSSTLPHPNDQQSLQAFITGNYWNALATTFQQQQQQLSHNSNNHSPQLSHLGPSATPSSPSSVPNSQAFVKNFREKCFSGLLNPTAFAGQLPFVPPPPPSNSSLESLFQNPFHSVNPLNPQPVSPNSTSNLNDALNLYLPGAHLSSASDPESVNQSSHLHHSHPFNHGSSIGSNQRNSSSSTASTATSSSSSSSSNDKKDNDPTYSPNQSSSNHHHRSSKESNRSPHSGGGSSDKNDSIVTCQSECSSTIE